MTRELYPCPLCGYIPKVKHVDGYGYTVECEGHFETNWYERDDAAIDTWNEIVQEYENKGERT